MKKAIIITALILLSACTQNSKLNIYGMPNPPTQGSPEYLTGWNAGCQTGMTSYANNHLRTRYKVKVDGHMTKHPHYAKGWELGQRYCSYYTSTYLSNSEFSKEDYRSDNSWFKLKVADNDFFQYKFGW